MFAIRLCQAWLVTLLLTMSMLSQAAETLAAAGAEKEQLTPVPTELISWRKLKLDTLDFEAALQSLRKADRDEYRRDMRRITAMLENQLQIKTLADEARQQGLDKDPLVQRELEYAKDRFLMTKRLEQWEAALVIPDLNAAAEERYQLKHSDFMIPERVHASHILITSEKRSDEEAKALAIQILAKARAGADFTELAVQFSDDPSVRRNRGDLGFFNRGKMVKPFEDAAFALSKSNDISEVLKSPFGYHIIKFHEKREAVQQSFEEVKANLLEQLKKQWISDQKAAYLAAIKNDKSIHLNQPAIDALLIK